jgi:predicted Co/Zn/Cd cation transporter (cation efflux family)
MGSIPVARVNLALPVDTMILIERECDKRGINRVQFIKEAIHEKLKTINENEVNLNHLREEIMELKKIILLSTGK